MLFQGEVENLKLAIIFLFCMVGAPMIYYGDEIGLPGNKDPDCRRCMDWSPDRWNRQVVDCYQHMASLRAGQPALRRGGYESLLAFERLFAFRRFTDQDNVIVLLNAGNAAIELTIETHSSHTLWTEYFSGQEYRASNHRLHLDFVSPASAAIFIGKAPESE
jgi:glycosidase